MEEFINPVLQVAILMSDFPISVMGVSLLMAQTTTILSTSCKLWCVFVCTCKMQGDWIHTLCLERHQIIVVFICCTALDKCPRVYIYEWALFSLCRILVSEMIEYKLEKKTVNQVRAWCILCCLSYANRDAEINDSFALWCNTPRQCWDRVTITRPPRPPPPQATSNSYCLSKPRQLTKSKV